MNKISIFVVICFFVVPLVVHAGGCKDDDYTYVDIHVSYAEEPSNDMPGVSHEKLSVEKEKSAELADDASSNSSKKSSGFRLKDRRFEIGLSANAGLSNNFLSANDIFKEIAVIDLDRFPSDFMFNFGIGIAPFHIAIKNRTWGYGLSTNLEAVGVLGLPGDLFSLKEAVDKKSELSGAIFAEAGIDIFFHISRFKITFRPAAYLPIAYFKSNISYTFVTSNGIDIDLGANARIYTAVPIENLLNEGFNPSDLKLAAFPGVDFSFGVEFPLTRVIGLQKALPFLDIDVGANFVNVPVYPSKMKNYMEFKSSLTIKGENINDLIDSFEDIDFDDLIHDPVYGEKETTVERPFRMNVFLNWRPFGKDFFTLIPSIGYSINQFYSEPFSMEYGLKARLDLINLLVLTAGVNYEDRMWVNSVELAFNIRLIELNIGADIRSHKFLKDIDDASGIGAKVGIKLGW